MTTITYNSLITIYYTALFIGILTLLLLLSFLAIQIINILAKRFKTFWIIVEYRFYRKDFKEFFKDKESVTGRFNNK